MTRREMLALTAAAATAPAQQKAPTAPVALARCRSYNEDITSILATMCDQIGGLGRIVANKTVTIKLNLTGSPALRLQGKAPALTHYTHPKTIGAMLTLLDRAGAKRIRLVESCWGTAGPLEEYMLDSGWRVRDLQNAAKNVVFENTNAKGRGTKYVPFRVPGKSQIFPAYLLNQAYDETDVFVSMAKLKEHATCGITLSMKNCFGNTPASIYGDDAGVDEPNESPEKGRVNVCHFGKRQPSRIAPSELDPSSSREPGYRMPRITAEIAAARPIHIAFIDGIESMSGGEGPWIKNTKPTQPGLMILGTNPVTTDTIGTVALGLNPRGQFAGCDNTLLLAESLGLGTADPKKIEVVGAALPSVG